MLVNARTNTVEKIVVDKVGKDLSEYFKTKMHGKKFTASTSLVDDVKEILLSYAGTTEAELFSSGERLALVLKCESAWLTCVMEGLKQFDPFGPEFERRIVKCQKIINSKLNPGVIREATEIWRHMSPKKDSATVEARKKDIDRLIAKHAR